MVASIGHDDDRSAPTGLFSRKDKDRTPEEPTPPPGGEQQIAALQREYAERLAAVAAQAVPPGAGPFDFSLASLEALDAYVGRFHDEGQTMTDDTVTAATAYLFETLSAAYGGRYLTGPPADPLVLVIGEPVCQIGVMGSSKIRGLRPPARRVRAVWP